MRILILSDLHFEAWRTVPRQAQALLGTLLPGPDSSLLDLVVLAGDIDTGERAVVWADHAFPGIPVVYVSGNHEAYGQTIDRSSAKLTAACAATGHVYHLDKSELVLGHVRILGATLWTDFLLHGEGSMQDAMLSAAASLSDYRKIRLAKAGYRKISPLYVAQWHWDDRTWLRERLAEAFNGKTVVVTRMAPSARSIPQRYRGQTLAAAFASDIEDLVSQSDLWIHGHIHESMDYSLGRARVVCNPLGYPEQLPDGQWVAENAQFDPNFVIELDPIDPGQKIAQDASALRVRLAEQWLSHDQVTANIRGIVGAALPASELRLQGKLLAVYLDEPAPCYRYPPWQFDSDGQPVAILEVILSVLREHGPFERERDFLQRTTGWGEVEWFLSPHSLLDSATPAEMLTSDPVRVLKAALIEFDDKG